MCGAHHFWFTFISDGIKSKWIRAIEIDRDAWEISEIWQKFLLSYYRKIISCSRPYRFFFFLLVLKSYLTIAKRPPIQNKHSFWMIVLLTHTQMAPHIKYLDSAAALILKPQIKQIDSTSSQKQWIKNFLREFHQKTYLLKTKTKAKKGSRRRRTFSLLFWMAGWLIWWNKVWNWPSSVCSLFAWLKNRFCEPHSWIINMYRRWVHRFLCQP